MAWFCGRKLAEWGIDMIRFMLLILLVSVCGPAFAIDRPILGSTEGPGVFFADKSNRWLNGSTFVWGANGVAPQIQVQSTGISILSSWSFNAGGAGPVLELGKSGGATVGSHGVTDTDLGSIFFKGDDGVAVVTGASIVVARNSGWSAGVTPTKFLFYTVPSGTSAQSLQAILDASGHFAVNTVGSVPGFTSGAIFPGVSASGTTSSTGSIGAHYANANTTGARFICGKSRGATANSHGVVVTGDTLCVLSAQADDGTNLLESGTVTFEVEGTVSSGITPGRIRLKTQNAAGTVTNAATIDSLQNMTLNSTGALTLPIGTTGQRPSAIGGMVRYNSTTTALEGYVNGAWQALSAAPSPTTSNTAPTVASGFCTSPTISASNGTSAFTISVGTACAASTGTLTMPAAPTGWVCDIHNQTNNATNLPDQTGGSTTTVTMTNYVRTTGVAGNWVDSDVLRVKCSAY